MFIAPKVAEQSRRIQWQVEAIRDQTIGYANLSLLVAPAPLPGAMELQQIYVLNSWHGSGVADDLMHSAIKTARAAARLRST